MLNKVFTRSAGNHPGECVGIDRLINKRVAVDALLLHALQKLIEVPRALIGFGLRRGVTGRRVEPNV